MAALPGPPSPWSARGTTSSGGAWPAPRADDAAGPPTLSPAPPLPPLPVPPGLSARRLGPADRAALEATHAALFPVDYEPAFYDAVTSGADGVFAYGLFEEGEEAATAAASTTASTTTTPSSSSALVAFVTARAVPWWELSPADVGVLGLAPPPGAMARDGTPHHQRGGGGGGGAAPCSPSPVAAVYVLTLGVASPARRRSGAGRALMAAVSATARAWGAGAVYLHVAAFNGAALAFYASLGRGGGPGGGGEACPPPYLHARTLPAFYSIPKRPPVPGVTRYDAHLLVARLAAAAAEGCARPSHHLPAAPAWSRRSPLASPPLLPAEVAAAGERGEATPVAAAWPAALVAGWARRAWAALPAPPAWARRMFSKKSEGVAVEAGAARAGEGRARLPPVMVGDII